MLQCETKEKSGKAQQDTETDAPENEIMTYKYTKGEVVLPFLLHMQETRHNTHTMDNTLQFL